MNANKGEVAWEIFISGVGDFTMIKEAKTFACVYDTSIRFSSKFCTAKKKREKKKNNYEKGSIVCWKELYIWSQKN